MSTNHTQNYNLSQWERTDQVKMEDFNADNAKIDAALKTQADTLTAHATALSKLGNCEIVHFTYKGTGVYGEGNPTLINFPKKPLLYIIFGIGVAFGTDDKYCVVCGRDGAGSCHAEWVGNQLQLVDTNKVRYAEYQMNSGMTYHVFAFYTQGA